MDLLIAINTYHTITLFPFTRLSIGSTWLYIYLFSPIAWMVGGSVKPVRVSRENTHFSRKLLGVILLLIGKSDRWKRAMRFSPPYRIYRMGVLPSLRVRCCRSMDNFEARGISVSLTLSVLLRVPPAFGYVRSQAKNDFYLYRGAPLSRHFFSFFTQTTFFAATFFFLLYQ